jgi:protein SPT2
VFSPAIVEADSGSSASPPVATGMSTKKTGFPKSSGAGTKSSTTSKLSPALKALSTDSRLKRAQISSGSTAALGSTKVTTKSMPKTSAGVRAGLSSRKRTRSLSLLGSGSPSPPPTKRRAPPETPSHNAVKDEIWKMFGKDRNKYVGRDVMSDDEDMEADATALEMEEFRRLVVNLTLNILRRLFSIFFAVYSF